jgi:xanthine dehydrogenase accessory factor
VPAGLDLGKTTHQEIAVAILAELVQLRASGALPGSGTGAGASAKPGRRKAADRPAEAVDPVCGMTVAAGSSLLLRHDGAEYYFCCAGCRQAFEQDPDAYTKKETRC